MYIYICVCVCVCVCVCLCVYIHIYIGKAYLEYCHCQFIEHNATRLTNEKKINI